MHFKSIQLVFFLEAYVQARSVHPEKSFIYRVFMNIGPRNGQYEPEMTLKWPKMAKNLKFRITQSIFIVQRTLKAYN